VTDPPSRAGSPGDDFVPGVTDHAEEIATMGTMQVSVERPRKTVEDLWSLPEGVRGELIGGEVYVTPAPMLPHQTAAATLTWALVDYARRHGGGSAYAAPIDVHLPTGDVVQPDVLWVSSARSDILRDWVYGAPDLVIEILSPSNPERDRIVKRDVYARSGVREYWIADPASRSLEVFVLEGGRYLPAGWFTPGTQVTSRLLPGFAVSVDEVFPNP
jgi:Uma2 family endonuclease